MPNIQVEQEQTFKTLSKEQRTELAGKIRSWWVDFHNKRGTQLTTAKELQKYISLNQPSKKSASWKSDIKENKIYTTWDSLKSSMWREIWSNESQMFDVAGTSKENEENAEKQKQAIVYALKKMNAGVQFDIATNSWGVYGDFIFKTDWKRRSKKVKRFDEFKGFIDVELPLEENANIEAINPMFFNFDTTAYKEGDAESWDRCIKIYKRFTTIEEIKANPIYQLTKEQELELDIKDNSSPTDKLTDDDLALKLEYGNQVEVLYLHGDVKFNGTMYKNVVAEVLAGKFLIYFDANPIFINPFVYGYTELDLETGRGISPLKSILEMCKGKEDLVNTFANMAKLNSCPPVWGSDSFLKGKYQNAIVPYEPGKYLEYEDSYRGGFPQAITFDMSGISDVISILANDISDASSVNANVMGNVVQGKRLATDLQLAQRGADSRTAMKLDKIYQINLKVIENVAELLAIFKTEPEILLVNEKGKRIEVEINAAIRQASYNYFYEDRNALIDRRQKFQEAFNIINTAAENPEIASYLDLIEAVKTGLEMTGFDNVEKFFKKPSPIDQAADFIKNLPPDLQNAVLQAVQPVIQQAQDIMKANGENQEGVQAYSNEGVNNGFGN